MPRKFRNDRKSGTVAGGAAPTPGGDVWNWKLDGCNTVIILIVTIVAFANCARNEFVYDAITIIRDNPRLKSPWHAAEFLGTSYWGEADMQSGLYRPLAIWSFAFDRALFGSTATGVHLANVVANGLVAVLVYVLLRQALGRRDVALLAALIYGLHPVHTEVVASGVGRADLGATAAALGAMILHLRYSQSAAGLESLVTGTGPGQRPPALARSRRKPCVLLAGALLLYWIGLLFKESIVALPVLIFLMEWLLEERGRLGPMVRRAGRFAIYALPLLAYLLMRMKVVGLERPALQEVMYGATGVQRFLYASETVMRYLGQLLVPVQLCAEYSDYSRPVRPSITDPLVALSLLHWVVPALLLVWLVRKGHFAVTFGIAAFYVALLPVSNLLFPIGTVRADRLLYFPSLGFALVAGCGLAKLVAIRRTPACVLIVAVMAPYGWRSMTRNADWRNNEALWPVTVRQNPGSPIAHAFMGDIYEKRGDFAQAESEKRWAFELRDGPGRFYPEAHNSYAALLQRRGDRAGAEIHYRLVLEHDPRQTTALINLAEILVYDPAKRAEAIALLKRALAIKPQDPAALVNLSAAHEFAGEFSEAMKYLEMAMQIVPDRDDLWMIKSDLYTKLGQPDAAAAARRQAERIRGR